MTRDDHWEQLADAMKRNPKAFENPPNEHVRGPAGVARRAAFYRSLASRQHTLPLDLHQDSRPLGERNAAERYTEPSLMDWIAENKEDTQ
jgi:hypothetical protein